MSTVRHHLRIAEGLLTCARANLETAFALTIDARYDPPWPDAIDHQIFQLSRLNLAVNNITTMIERPIGSPV